MRLLMIDPQPAGPLIHQPHILAPHLRHVSGHLFKAAVQQLVGIRRSHDPWHHSQQQTYGKKKDEAFVQSDSGRSGSIILQ
ncbi:hypothetical protein GCM10010917_38800 [Paenibacillus physcomitrellae]|uniref:Uncharacterized protein n=1 Tax=Paenibacillus physcomitrellae TaxID=1619311 RepID=A0ABQ1GTW4_9BACL|nr:hypothetical protein GCM10010917_38800 [Paenibacillus physcomitrellae]